MNKIFFKIVSREDPSIYIEGSVDMADGSDFCLTFYDSYEDASFRIPINPYIFYSEEYYKYIELVYAFENDEEFFNIIEKYSKRNDPKVIIFRDTYNIELTRGV